MANIFKIDRASVRRLLDDYQALNLNEGLGTEDYDLVYRAELSKLDEEKLAAMLEAAFDASLHVEEGKLHRFRIVVSPPESAFEHLKSEHTGIHNHGSFTNLFSFATPIRIEKLAKIAPAFEGTNRKLHVWFNEQGDIEIWGAVGSSSYFDYRGLEITAFAAGQLLIQRELPTPELPRHLLTFSRLERITRNSPLFNLVSGGRIEGEKPNLSKINHDRRLYSLFVDIINRMSAHEHGGTLLVVPSDFAFDSLDCPIIPSPPYSYIEDKRNREEREDAYQARKREGGDSTWTRTPFEYHKDSEFIGQLTAIDGATLVTKELTVLALGVKIKSSSHPKRILIQDSFQTDEERTTFVASQGHEVADLDGLGGTRHQSAARFVFENRARNAFAIVASQDGRVSIIYCDREDTLVVFRHAEYYYFGVKL